MSIEIGIGTAIGSGRNAIAPIATALTYVGKTNPVAGFTTSQTITVPAGVQDDDILFMIWTAGTHTQATPAGWSLVDSVEDDRKIYVWKRVASSEPADYTITSAFQWSAGGMVAYRGTISAYTTGTPASQSNGSSTSIVFPSVTTVKNAQLLCFAVTELNTTMTPDAAMTERWDVGVGSNHQTYFMDELITSAGSTGTRTATVITPYESHTITVAVAEDV